MPRMDLGEAGELLRRQGMAHHCSRPAQLAQAHNGCVHARRAPERILFCGWRRDMHDMIAVLDAFVYPGSELWLYNEVRMLGLSAITLMMHPGVLEQHALGVCMLCRGCAGEQPARRDGLCKS